MRSLFFTLLPIAPLSAAIVSVTPMGETVTVGNDTLGVNLDRLGSDDITLELTFFPFPFNNELTIGVTPSATSSVSTIGNSPPSAATRLLSMTGITESDLAAASGFADNGQTAFLAANAEALSSPLFAGSLPTDTQWDFSNTPGFAIFEFESNVTGSPEIHRGFAEIAIDAATTTATLLSYGFDDVPVNQVPEPSSALLSLLALAFLTKRKR